jgi:hypothetical protein
MTTEEWYRLEKSRVFKSKVKPQRSKKRGLTILEDQREKEQRVEGRQGRPFHEKAAIDTQPFR